MASTDCKNTTDGFTASDLVLTGCLSFLAGISVVLIFFLIMKWKAEHKLCFREKEEPCKGKWEGASRKKTLQVLRKHTLERSQSGRSENSGKQAETGVETAIELEITESKPAELGMVETCLNAELDQDMIADENKITVTEDVCQQESNDQVSSAPATTRVDGNKDETEAIKRTHTDSLDAEVKETKMEIQEADTESVSGSGSEPSDDGGSQTKETKNNNDNDIVVSPDDIVKIEITPEEIFEENNEEQDRKSSNESLKAIQLYESGRDSSVFDPPHLVIQNDNFRISKLSNED